MGCVMSPLISRYLPNTEFRTLLILMTLSQALFAFLNGSASIVQIPESLALNITGYAGQALIMALVTAIAIRELLRSVNLAKGINIMDSELYTIVLNLLQACSIVATITGPYISTCLLTDPRNSSSALGCMALALFLVYLIYNIFALNKEAQIE